MVTKQFEVFMVFGRLRRGAQYMAIWPMHAVVGALPEIRVIQATRVAARWLPVAAMLNVGVQWQWFGFTQWPSLLATTLFMLLLPLQGYWWLGRRADSRLPRSLAAWCNELRERLNASGKAGRVPPVPNEKLTYFVLARTLQQVLALLPASALDGDNTPSQH